MQRVQSPSAPQPVETAAWMTYQNNFDGVYDGANGVQAQDRYDVLTVGVENAAGNAGIQIARWSPIQPQSAYLLAAT
eukprot:SAG22_NODE_10102_length_553_cov_0.662996_2_plen_76_part_01